MFIPDVGRDNEKNRNEWLRITLAQLPDGSRILDAGAGELKNRQFCTHLEYVSQDFCEYNGKGDEHALQTGKWDTSKVDIVSDIINIPVDDCEFDYVICTEVLEHLPEPILALRELTRVLKEGGEIILTAPFCSLTHFAPYHFSTGFNRYFYEYHLNKLGFEIMDIATNGDFFHYLAQENFRLNSISEKYTGTKLSFFEKVILFFMQRAIKKRADMVNKSDEVLCYGYHVRARKIN